MKYLTLLVLVLVIAIEISVSMAADPCICGRGNGHPAYKVLDDKKTSVITGQVRDHFLTHRVAHPEFKTLEVTVLVKKPGDNNVWYRGMTDGATTTSYPASTVKLAYMAASMHFCGEMGLPLGCIDGHVRPMMTHSDNFETGVVVDLLTGAPNLPNMESTDDPRWPEFLHRRSYTMNLLERFNLLGNQIIFSKTYPTNSGGGVYGAELVGLNTVGRNAMQSCCAASLLLDLRKGGPLLSNATKPGYATKQQLLDYATSTLFHRRYDAQSSFAYSMPPGTLVHSKSGNAYTTVEEIAHITLPNKREVILSVYSPDGWQRGTDFGILGLYAEMLLESLGLYEGLPPTVKVHSTDPDANYVTHGSWNHVDRDQCRDCLGDGAIVSKDTDASVEWTAVVDKPGLYELTAYSPTIQQASHVTASVTVNHEHGKSTHSWNQRIFSRWQPLGEFYFKRGKNKIVIKRASGSSGTLVFDAIKLSRFPYCNGAPGAFC